MRFLYILNEGLSGFRRAKLAAAGSVTTIAIALTMLGIYAIVSTNTSRLVSQVRERVEMEAFLQEPVSAAGIAALRDEVANLQGVERVEIVTKEEAAKIFKEEFGQDIGRVLIQPLPPSLRIFLKESSRTAPPPRLSRLVGQIQEWTRCPTTPRISSSSRSSRACSPCPRAHPRHPHRRLGRFPCGEPDRLAIYAKRASVQT
jgi:cell division transport system permease protein